MYEYSVYKFITTYLYNIYLERWLSAFKYFKELNITIDCLLIVVEFSFSLPGSNAAVERVFSLMNSTWTKSRNKLDINTVEALLMIKTSLDNMSCCQFNESILANKTLLQKVHISAKYQTTQTFFSDEAHIEYRLNIL
ncbi:protein FAM200B-like [Aphis craccivora]|uniref:Protein FAM200B-like n=1 Tax=Aphis craccivora TaxID=307492 RepID=A0A6G0YLZ5_APHCR|nr:protein FAM200B-like [Aphis craccivora]